MKDIELFQIALGISSPWFVKSLELAPAAKRLDIHLDFQKGSKFTCPECGAEGRKVHDTTTKTWRHINFFSMRPTSRPGFQGSTAASVASTWFQSPGRARQRVYFAFRGVCFVPGSSYAH